MDNHGLMNRAMHQVTGDAPALTKQPQPGPAALIQHLTLQMNEYQKTVSKLKERVEKLESESPVPYVETRLLAKTRKRRVMAVLGGKGAKAYQDASLRGKVFSALASEYKAKFRVAVYADTMKASYRQAQRFLSRWLPNQQLYQQIQQANESED